MPLGAAIEAVEPDAAVLLVWHPEKVKQASATMNSQRAANFGDRLTLNVSVDGAQVATLVMGRSYNGALSPGQHVLTLSVDPNLAGTPPMTKRLTVQAGQTYSFTAMWSGQRLVLR